MKSFTALLMVLVAVGALAKPQPGAAYQSNSYNCYNGGYESSVPVLNTHIHTSSVENPTVSFSSFVSPSTVSDACHCLQTFVKPQIHNEIITVPTIDRIVRTVPGSPVVETINCGGTTRLTFSPANSMQSATRSLTDGGQGNTQGSSATNTNSLFNGGNTETPSRSSNSLNAGSTANRATATLIATPTSVFTFQPSVESVARFSNAFSGNSGYSNTRMNSY